MYTASANSPLQILVEPHQCGCDCGYHYQMTHVPGVFVPAADRTPHH